MVVKVNPGRTDLVTTRTLDGKPCLVIELSQSVEVNGISVRSGGDFQEV